MTAPTLREWQSNCLTLLHKWTEPEFLLVATPAAGKSRVAAEELHRRLDHHDVERVVVVVPSDRLTHQWVRGVHGTVGIDLAKTWDELKAGRSKMRGIVVTYQLVATAPHTELLDRFCRGGRTMVILDEVHHAGEQASWGDALRRAFAASTFRLSLSGTPFRSDGTAIPFLTYEPNELGQLVVRADYRYSYGQALADFVVRDVHFPKLGGRTEWAWDGSIHGATFDEDLSEDQASRRLNTALRTGTFLPTLLGQAIAQLDKLRSDDPDAGGLVLAIDRDHAQMISDEMVKLNPQIRPLIITSHDIAAKTKLDAFARSADPWLIAIKMVSEGVDIPRLRVAVHATNVTTHLFFRQAVGRVLRVEDGCEDDPAFYFIPDDPVLRRFAQEMKQERDEALRQSVLDATIGSGGTVPSTFVPLDSEGTTASVTYDGDLYTPAELDEAEQVRTMLHLPKTWPSARIAQIARFYRSAPLGEAASHPTLSVPLRERMAKLRKQNSRVARRIAIVVGLDHMVVEGRLNDSVGVRSVKNANEDQLKARLEAASRWLADVEPEIATDWE